MKKISLSKIFIVSLVLICSVNARAFNNGSFLGNYAFRLTGPSSLVQASEPQTVGTGILKADGRGHVSGHGTFRSAGATCNGQISGTYSIQTDGTGTLSSTFSTSTPGCFTSVIDLAIVLANNGKVFEVSNTENDYMSGSLARQ